MYVCMYVCMYICLYQWMDGWMDVFMHACNNTQLFSFLAYYFGISDVHLHAAHILELIKTCNSFILPFKVLKK
jgi:hypothetical protein